VQPGVKVNGDYYREVLLKEKLLPFIKEISGDNFIFQHVCAQGTWHNLTFTPRHARVQTSFLPTSGPQTAQIWIPCRVLQDLGCNTTAGLRETRKWRRRAVSAPVEYVAQHWTKRHRWSNRSVACATHRLCASKRRPFWIPDVKQTWTKCSTVTWHFASVLNWIWRCCISTHLTFQVSQGSAATDLRWGENFNKFLFSNSLLNILVKKYENPSIFARVIEKIKVSRFFMDHSV